MTPGLRLLWCGVCVTVVAGCVDQRDAIMKSFDLSQPYTALEPAVGGVEDLGHAMSAYVTARAGSPPEGWTDLTLRQCLQLGVEQNRRLRKATYATARIGLGRDIARSELDGTELTGTYSIDRGPDTGEGRISAVNRLGGFDVEPFLEFNYSDAADSSTTTSYGIAVSRNVFRIRYQYLRQNLPLTRATRNYHVAINDRVVQLRDLHLQIVSLFYDIQRLKKLIEVRQNRVKDAEDFLQRVREQVRNGFSAPVEETNAGISLNQAASDLVREETNLRNTKEDLLDVIGLDIGTALTIRGEDLAEHEAVDLALAQDMETVKRCHERVVNQLLLMEVQRQEYQVRQEELVPDLDARVTASRDVDEQEVRGNLGLDLTLSLPLDGYRAQRARATQERLRLMELAVDLADIRSGLERALRARYRNVHQLQTTVRLKAERLKQEQKKLGATLELWEKTKGNNLELTRAKQAVDDAEVSLLESRVRRIVEESRYRSLLPAPGEHPIIHEMPAIEHQAEKLLADDPNGGG